MLMTQPTFNPAVLASQRDRAGTLELGHFRLNTLLSRGRHASAYLATHVHRGEQVVVRIGHLGRLGGAESFAVRGHFEHQAAVATKVRHRCLPKVLASGRTRDGAPALATAFVPGTSLHDILENHGGDLSPGLIGEWFGQLGRALEVLHDSDVAHRNLRADKIVVAAEATGRSVIRLLDFGVSEAAGRAASRQRREHGPRYLPPEQILGTAGPSADVFALGALIWWALVGQEFRPEVRTLEDLAYARVNGVGAVDPRAVVSLLPPSAAELVSRMLSFDESERPTISEFLEAWPSVIEDFPRAEPEVPDAAAKPVHTIRATASLALRPGMLSADRLVQTTAVRPPQRRPAAVPSVRTKLATVPSTRAKPSLKSATTPASAEVRAAIDPAVRERLLAANSKVTTAEIARFLRAAPEVLTQISDSLDGRFFSGARRAARYLDTRAGAVGATRLGRLCRVFSELIRDSELDRLTGLAEHTSAAELHAFFGLAREMGQEYAVVFAELETIRAAVTRP